MDCSKSFFYRIDLSPESFICALRVTLIVLDSKVIDEILFRICTLGIKPFTLPQVQLFCALLGSLTKGTTLTAESLPTQFLLYTLFFLYVPG